MGRLSVAGLRRGERSVQRRGVEVLDQFDENLRGRAQDPVLVAIEKEARLAQAALGQRQGLTYVGANGWKTANEGKVKFNVATPAGVRLTALTFHTAKVNINSYDTRKPTTVFTPSQQNNLTSGRIILTFFRCLSRRTFRNTCV